MQIWKVIGRVSAGLSLAWAACASAQQYPVQPVTIEVPFPAGGPTDIIARAIAQRLQVAFGQAFIVDNKPGATGLIGTAAVARAKPDGYTLLLTSNSSHIIAPLLREKPGFDPIKDFEPLTLLAGYPFCLTVTNTLPAKNLQELMTLAKSKPGQLFFGSVGNGSGNHLMTELFKQKADIDMVHVPYNGGAAASNALMANQVQVYFDTVGAAKSFIDSGRVRALAVTSEQRAALLPEVPTLKEQGLPGVNPTIWLGMFAPRGTPAAITETLVKEIRRILDTDPEVRERIANLGAEVLDLSPRQTADALRAEQQTWRTLIDRLHVRLE